MSYWILKTMGPDGQPHQKTLSKRLYASDDIEKIKPKWKALIKEGKYQEAKDLKPSLAVEKHQAPIMDDPTDVNSLFEFRDLSSIELPTNGGQSWALIGSTRSGKSTAMCWLWENIYKKHITLLTTGSHHADIYKPLHKACAVAPEFYPELLKESMKLNKEAKNKYPILHIFDDMIDGKNTKALTKLLTIGRNANCSTIICGQDLTMLNSIGRTNINYICCFKLNSDLAIEKVVKNWLRHFFPSRMKLIDMYKLYRKLTEDHQFIVVNTLTNEIFLSKISVE
jgi:hypothetical protein